MLKISDFTVEYRASGALGLDEAKPRFSWVLCSDRHNVVQAKYAISVAAGGKAVWSCEEESPASVLVEYAGEKLLPRTQYQAVVTVTDNYGESASASLVFETGVMEEGLKGDFIACPFGDVVPEFFKEIVIAKPVQRARIYATALGVYELFLGGRRVGEDYDAPGWTSYSHRLQYQTYDITDLLHEGKNTLSALVGKGWYAGTVGYFHRKNSYGDTSALCLDLYLGYTDGTSERISTDETWQARESALRFSEFQDGEVYDSTFRAETAQPVRIAEYDKSKIVAQIGEPVRVTGVLAAKGKIVTPKGEQVLDFGQNASGIAEFTVQGARGQKVTISHAEVLDEAGNFYTENLRGAKAQDVYVLSGEKQTLRPHFTTHGFRYIRVEGLDNVRPEDFRFLVLHTDMKKTGEFICENVLVNRLQQNIVWGQRSNFLDIPTDCPQRDERLGWTGDAQMFCRTASFNYNVAPFFQKWLGDLAAEQTKEDGVPQTVPNVIPGKEKGAAAWGDAATICPDTMYEAYGDKRILERQYESMKGWVEYIRARSQRGLWLTDFQYGDWLALDKEEGSSCTGATDRYFIASAYYVHSTALVAKAARILGREEDAAEYEALYRDIIASFREEFVTPRGRLVSETQTAMVLALAFELVPEKFRADIAGRLRANLKEHRDHLVTGFVGTPYLMHVLTLNGMHDVAETLLLNEDYPSWLYEVKMGATTIWERWNAIQPDGTLFEPSMSSFNHYAYGSVGDWLYRRGAGIDCLEAGYKKISIAPHPVRALGNVSASYLTPYGEVSVVYEYREGKILYQIKVPVNTAAEIILPDGQKYSVGSGKYCYESKDEGTQEEIRGLSHTMKEALADVQCTQLLARVLTETQFRQIGQFGGGHTLKEFLAAFPDHRATARQIAAILEEKNGV